MTSLSNPPRINPSGRSAGATGRGRISTEFESLPPRRSLARCSQLAAASRKAKRTASGGLRLPRRLILSAAEDERQESGARRRVCIEILSDDEEADGAGPSGAIVIGDDDMPEALDSTDALVGEVVHPSAHREHQGDFPPHAHGDGASASTSSIGTVEMSSKDLLTLEDHEFLNDSVIEFFIKNLQHKKMPPEKAARCHIFNSFFYEKLTNVRDERSSRRGRATEKSAPTRGEVDQGC